MLTCNGIHYVLTLSPLITFSAHKYTSDTHKSHAYSTKQRTSRSGIVFHTVIRSSLCTLPHHIVGMLRVFFLTYWFFCFLLLPYLLLWMCLCIPLLGLVFPFLACVYCLLVVVAPVESSGPIYRHVQEEYMRMYILQFVFVRWTCHFAFIVHVGDIGYLCSPHSTHVVGCCFYHFFCH